MKIKLIALFIMMRSLAAIADNDTYFFSKVDYQQGLSNSAVLCLFQDNVGLMWFGTYDGVNCWDGKTMEVPANGEFSNIMHNPLPQTVTFGQKEKARFIKLEATTPTATTAQVEMNEIGVTVAP